MLSDTPLPAERPDEDGEIPTKKNSSVSGLKRSSLRRADGGGGTAEREVAPKYPRSVKVGGAVVVLFVLMGVVGAGVATVQIKVDDPIVDEDVVVEEDGEVGGVKVRRDGVGKRARDW